MGQSPEIRASDHDREQVAALLRDAHAEGRLSQEEFFERLDATYTARTHGDLEHLVADLPRPATRQEQVGRPATSTPPFGKNVETRSGSGKALTGAWTVWAVAVSVNLVVWLLVSLDEGDAQYFWPMWVAGPWGAVLLALTLGRRR